MPSQHMKSSLSGCLAVLGNQSKLTTSPEGVLKGPLKTLKNCPACGGFSVLVAFAPMNPTVKVSEKLTAEITKDEISWSPYATLDLHLDCFTFGS